MLNTTNKSQKGISMKTTVILLAALLLITSCDKKNTAEETTTDGSEVTLMEEMTTANELPSFLKEGLSKEEQDKLKQEIMPILDDGLSPEQRFLNLRKKAQEGDAESQNSLGSMFFSGEAISHDAKGKPLARDPEAAAGWFYRAAEQGLADAQFNLGLLYFTGEGVEQNKTKAIELFTQSAEQGNTDAQNNLGVIYLMGEGVEQSTKKAIEWFEKAAEQNNEEAIENLKAIRQSQQDIDK